MTDWMWCAENPKEAAAEIDRVTGERDRIDVAIGELAIENRKLREQLVTARAAIQRYLDGDFGRDKYFKTKHDTCPHGQFQWQGCEPCVDDYFKRVLATFIDDQRGGPNG